MSNISINIENLSKQYRIGQRKSGSLRESFSNILRKKGKNFFWALKDINLEISHGDTFAIIGSNGAGKSTLLKILSKITYPTKGRAVMEGRVSSLLEVGTGFHPELTGRQNIYLNGTILGMSKMDIRTKFDEIVFFSGIEEFIDTPVKHYSSGMKVRLAFSVAAHLEPEILIIDEVLAVGDSTFQKKCLDKMTEISNRGHTLLFVSHNMQAVKNLCNRGVFLKNGEAKYIGSTTDTIEKYLFSNQTKNNQGFLEDLEDRKGDGKLIFSQIRLSSEKINVSESLDITFKLRTIDKLVFKDLLLGINIYDRNGQSIYHLSNLFIGKEGITHTDDENEYKFVLKKVTLKPGFYTISLFLRANEEIKDWVQNVIRFEVLESNLYGFSNSAMIQGLFQPDFTFEIKK